MENVATLFRMLPEPGLSCRIKMARSQRSHDIRAVLSPSRLRKTRLAATFGPDQGLGDYALPVGPSALSSSGAQVRACVQRRYLERRTGRTSRVRVLSHGSLFRRERLRAKRRADRARGVRRQVTLTVPGPRSTDPAHLACIGDLRATPQGLAPLLVFRVAPRGQPLLPTRRPGTRSTLTSCSQDGRGAPPTRSRCSRRVGRRASSRAGRHGAARIDNVSADFYVR